MSYISIDVEADGPIPGDYSMISFGAVVVEPSLAKTFYAQLKPISDKWIPEALEVSKFTRAETLTFEDPQVVMSRFADWIDASSSGRALFIADNNGFDWQFINWYFHHFYGQNPFGHTSNNLGSLYKGIVKDTFVNFKHLRKTAHTHNALDDARGNAEALLQLKQDFGLKISLK
ncbi:exonuclease domain-containing protein [Chamaesiphon minutus]|uniref:DNA polymerase III epsilon subunit-like 3'-5' exonuclease n=1 Tax=Chamaesiphon minutus (strain ATCC 27169 / PCC 6605) TaxID=1173020 RepID=K9UHL0_CHAP6|nr:exonuclease domain-containing protein [Chamaesiphon minutus]AFY94602.1 DNA polymerase III epsilon subunit-like 3'-5' exonuclease [Chamaesiphon minutus PCC 6605]